MQRPPKRTVCNHDITASELEQYDIDSTPLEVPQASNAHSNMSKDTWDHLDPKMKELWNNIFDDMSKGNWDCLDLVTQQLLDTIFDDVTVEGLVKTDRPAFRSARPAGNFPTGRPTPRPPRPAADTTRFTSMAMRNVLQKPDKSPFLACHFHRRKNEDVATEHPFRNILTGEMNPVRIYHSNVCSYALVPAERNLRMDPLGGETTTPIIKSRQDLDENGETKKNPNGGDNGETSNMPKIPVFYPAGIVGCTFFLDPKEDGHYSRAHFVRAITEQDDELAQDPTKPKFLCSISVEVEEHEEILHCADDVLNHIENVAEEDGESVVWKFKRGDELCAMTMHKGSLQRNHLNWKHPQCNFMIDWETGEITTEPLTGTIVGDDSVACALYPKTDSHLLKHNRSIAKRQSFQLRIFNQAKLRSFRTASKYKQDEYYDTFKGYGHSGKLADGYKKIRVHGIIEDKRYGETTKTYPAHHENGNDNGETSSHHVDTQLFQANLLTGLILSFKNGFTG